MSASIDQLAKEIGSLSDLQKQAIARKLARNTAAANIAAEQTQRNINDADIAAEFASDIYLAPDRLRATKVITSSKHLIWFFLVVFILVGVFVGVAYAAHQQTTPADGETKESCTTKVDNLMTGIITLCYISCILFGAITSSGWIALGSLFPVISFHTSYIYFSSTDKTSFIAGPIVMGVLALIGLGISYYYSKK